MNIKEIKDMMIKWLHVASKTNSNSFKTILWNSVPWNLMEMTYSLGMGSSMMTPNFKSNFTKIIHILHQKY